MNDLRTAAQQALEALEQCGLDDTRRNYALESAAITALRAALAEPTCKEGLQVEPVAWRYKGEPWFDGNRWHDKFEVTTEAKFKHKDATPLYTAPPQMTPLTEEEIAEALAGVLGLPHEIKVELARAIERAHGIGGDGSGVA